MNVYIQYIGIFKVYTVYILQYKHTYIQYIQYVYCTQWGLCTIFIWINKKIFFLLFIYPFMISAKHFFCVSYLFFYIVEWNNENREDRLACMFSLLIRGGNCYLPASLELSILCVEFGADEAWMGAVWAEVGGIWVGGGPGVSPLRVDCVSRSEGGGQ